MAEPGVMGLTEGGMVRFQGTGGAGKGKGLNQGGTKVSEPRPDTEAGDLAEEQGDDGIGEVKGD